MSEDWLDRLEQVGPYRITGLIGRGGMGAVFRARHQSLDRVVALKVLTADVSADPIQLTRFRRECESITGLGHPGLVKVFDFGEDAGVWYMAMELVTGRTLAERIESEGALSVSECLRYTRELTDALAALHASKVLHRDLKPGNVMVDEDDHVRVLDLGLVKQIDRTVLTEQGFRLGSPRYMPPEMIQDGLSEASGDVWQIGLIAYEMYHGVPAYPETVVPKLLGIILAEDPPPLPRREGVEVDRFLEFVKRCLLKDRARRFANAGEALSFLQGPGALRPGGARTPRAERTGRFAGRPGEAGRSGAAGVSGISAASAVSGSEAPRRGLTLALAVGLMVASGTGTTLWLRARQAPEGDAAVPVVAGASAASPFTPPRGNPQLAASGDPDGKDDGPIESAAPAPAPSSASYPAWLVQRLARQGLPLIRKGVFEELRNDLAVATPKTQAALVKSWRERASQMVDRTFLAPLLQELDAMKTRLHVSEVPSPLRGVLLRRLTDLGDFSYALKTSLDIDLGLPLNALAGGDLSPRSDGPTGAKPIVRVEFGDVGRGAGRKPPEQPARVIRPEGTAMFGGGLKGFLSGMAGVDHRKDWRDNDLEVLPQPPTRAWVHYRLHGGRPGERIAVRIYGRQLNRPVDVAFLRAGVSPDEGWMEMDPRLVGCSRVILRIEYENRSSSLMATGLVLDFVELMAAF